MKIGIIGLGNMAKAIVKGLIRAGYDSKLIYATAYNKEKLAHNCELLGINMCDTNNELSKISDMIILAVKPKLIPTIIKENEEYFSNKIIVSIAAGYTFDKMFALFTNKNINLIITIPSTPVEVCEGVTICDIKNSLTKDQLESFNYIFSKLGLVKHLGPDKFSIASTITGCGPAFVYMIIESLADAGLKFGLTMDEAIALASQTLLGASKNVLESKKHPAILKNEVTSPAGTTIKGVTKLEELGLRNALIKAIEEIEK